MTHNPSIKPDGTHDPERIRAVADALVTSTAELESAFNQLSDGDTVYIERPATPYRTTQWLDVDASHVTIQFNGPKAANGEEIVKVADAADVGGIRVGYNNAVSDISIRGYGHDGNVSGHSSPSNHRDAIVVADAEYVDIRGFYLTRTIPYRIHNTGGSGITVGPNASNVDIHHGTVDDIGDRGVQILGQKVRVHAVDLINGFDRSINTSGASTLQGGSGDNIVVSECLMRDNAEGSLIGFGNVTHSPTNVTVTNCTARGQYRQFLQISGNVDGLRASDNDVTRSSTDLGSFPVAIGDSNSVNCTNVQIHNNYIHDMNASDCMDFANNVGRVHIRGNIIENIGSGSAAGNGIIMEADTDCVIESNEIDTFFSNAIVVGGAGSHVVRGNVIRNPDSTVPILVEDNTGGHRFESNQVYVGPDTGGSVLFEQSGVSDCVYHANWSSDTSKRWNTQGNQQQAADNVPPV